MKLLAIDIGNTNIVLGLFAGEQLAAHWRVSSQPLRTGDELAVVLAGLLREQAGQVRAAVVGSVVPQLTGAMTAAVLTVCGCEPLVIHSGLKLPVEIAYAHPEQVGPDRIANAMAARELYGVPAIVIDFGTATTFEVLDAQGRFLGGAILPGMRLALEGLFTRAALLASTDIYRPEHAIGRNTADCLRSGAYHGTVGSIREILARIREEMGGEPQVIATGGLYRLLEGSDLFTVVDQDLTLKGLRLLSQKLRGEK